MTSSWAPSFPGQRPPFERGNQLATKHATYSTVATGPRAMEIADELREVAPVYEPCDEPALRLCALLLARVERASAAIEEFDDRVARTSGSELAGYLVADAERLGRLRQDMRGWVNSATRLLDAFGMTPTSRARLAGDLAGAQRALTAQTLRERYGADGIGAA